MLYLLSCASNILLNSTIALHIVKSLVISDFSFVEKRSEMSQTHKITDVPNSQKALWGTKQKALWGTEGLGRPARRRDNF